MTELFWPLVSGIVVLAAFIAVRIVTARRQARRLAKLVLRPNCLLTRYPIVFLTKQKSLFRIFDEWRDLPGFMREHGYEVSLLQARLADDPPQVLRSIRALNTKCHLIGATAFEPLLHELADSRDANIVTLTVVGGLASDSRKRLVKDDLRPTHLAVQIVERPRSAQGPWSFEWQFLDHAISLAEHDAGWCD